MHILLTPEEARVLGALMEKEVSTPDHYPLSLDALTNACNQTTSRGSSVVKGRGRLAPTPRCWMPISAGKTDA